MGNALSAVDYRDYDYAKAVNIFSTTLNGVSSYLTAVESSATTQFRSTQTGYTFSDLRRIAAMLRNIDLDRTSSYITIHKVSTHDAATEISYYRWRIENIIQQRAVQQTRLNALTDSISAYEKDPVIIAIREGNSVVSPTDVNKNYDDMISRKMDAQAAVASYSRSISFYERVIEGFQEVSKLGEDAWSTPEDIEKVNTYLANLNNKLNDLVENSIATVDEYYSQTAFANRIRILIPATVEEAPVISKMIVYVILASELIVFILILGMLS